MRLIDADDLKETIYWFEMSRISKKEIAQAIDDMPTEEKRAQGKWIHVYPLTDKCSICNGEALDFNDYPYKSKFCPHCGAYMEGGGAVAEDDLHHPGP